MAPCPPRVHARDADHRDAPGSADDAGARRHRAAGQTPHPGARPGRGSGLDGPDGAPACHLGGWSSAVPSTDEDAMKHVPFVVWMLGWPALWWLLPMRSSAPATAVRESDAATYGRGTFFLVVWLVVGWLVYDC